MELPAIADVENASKTLIPVEKNSCLIGLYYGESGDWETPVFKIEL